MFGNKWAFDGAYKERYTRTLPIFGVQYSSMATHGVDKGSLRGRDVTSKTVSVLGR